MVRKNSNIYIQKEKCKLLSSVKLTQILECKNIQIVIKHPPPLKKICYSIACFKFSIFWISCCKIWKFQFFLPTYLFIDLSQYLNGATPDLKPWKCVDKMKHLSVFFIIFNYIWVFFYDSKNGTLTTCFKTQIRPNDIFS